MIERPLECSECQRPIGVRYSELCNDSLVEQVHCNECPVLLAKLHGRRSEHFTGQVKVDSESGLCCGSCGTTLEAVQTGNPLGCSECYEVFGDIIAEALAKSQEISSKLIKRSNQQLHIGRSPGETVEMSPSLRLLALNEALDETISREDYEQAAWLRDQIKELKERGHAS
jgi:protein arginine kinase activator